MEAFLNRWSSSARLHDAVCRKATVRSSDLTLFNTLYAAETEGFSPLVDGCVGPPPHPV
jgi:hypothetical protein